MAHSTLVPRAISVVSADDLAMFLERLLESRGGVVVTVGWIEKASNLRLKPQELRAVPSDPSCCWEWR
eukprot:15044276-Alexandrium_andersonii.AAC.1